VAAPSSGGSAARPFSDFATAIRVAATARATLALKGREYDPDLVPELVKQVCDQTLEDARAIAPGWKLIVSAIIVKRESARLSTHSSVFWDPAVDGCVTARLDTDALVAIVSIYGCTA